MSGDDHMEIGETGLVPKKGGWYLDANAGKMIDPDGKSHDVDEDGNTYVDDGMDEYPYDYEDQ